MKLEHIVHPTDFSAVSVNALRYAAAIAKHASSSIHLVHVYDRPYKDATYAGSISATVDRVFDTEIRQSIHHEMHQLAKLDFLAGLPLFEKLVADVPSWKFFEEINSEKCDLIVMGTQGATGLLHGGLTDTNAAKVIRHASSPVLSIPDGSTYNGFKRILFATDFNDEINQVFGHVVDFAKAFGAEIDVAMITTRGNYASHRFAQEQFDKLKAAFPAAKLGLLVYNADSVEDGIAHLVESNSIDLVAMLTHGRKGLSHLLQGSITEDVASHIKVPLLALKASKA